MVQGGMTCIKYLLFVFNFIFVVCGIALISVGALVQSTGREYTQFLNSGFLTAPTILIIVGCVIFLIAFLGCCGAIKENNTMLMGFAVLVFLIFVIEIAGGITAYVYRGEVESFLKKRMNETLQQQKEFYKIWDEMQIKLKCCGVDGPNDWKTVNETAGIPSSCCGKHGETCMDSEIYKEGCYKALEGKLQSDIAMVGGVGIGIAVVELLGIVFACCLSAAIKKEYEGV